MVKRHILNGKSLPNCLSLKLVRCKIMIKQLGLNRIGKIEEWLDMGGNKPSQRVIEEQEVI